MDASLSLFELEHTGKEKYGYFICGLAGALIAYIGKDFKPSYPLTTHDLLTISTLGCLIVSFIFGLGYILCWLKGVEKNKNYLFATEQTGEFVDTKNRNQTALMTGNRSVQMKNGNSYTIFEIEKEIADFKVTSQKNRERMVKWYRASKILFIICHLFLIAGFVLLLLSKILL